MLTRNIEYVIGTAFALALVAAAAQPWLAFVSATLVRVAGAL